MHRRAIIAIETQAKLLRQRSRRALAISTQTTRTRPHQVNFVREVVYRGYRSARARSAEIVVHRRVMQYAKDHDRKNSERESLTECVSTILSMSPALRPMKESA
jgi:hypothetical protein